MIRLNVLPNRISVWYSLHFEKKVNRKLNKVLSFFRYSVSFRTIAEESKSVTEE